MIVGQGLGLLPGATLATVGMLLAVLVETSLTHWAARSTISGTLSRKPPEPQPLTFRYLWYFYLPLAVTTLLRQGIRPLISAGIAVASMAELSLAAWPVAFSLAAIFWGPTMALRQVTVALTEDRESWHKVNRFVFAAGAVLTISLGLISFTPLLEVVLERLFGLSAQLASLAAPATRIMVLLPLAYTFHALFTGLLVKKAHTATVRTAKIINLATVGLVLFAGVRYGHLWGSVLGAIAITSGAFLEAIWLYWRSRSAITEIASLDAKAVA